MSYYKITYESDTMDGLKAIQGNSAGRSANAGSNSIEDSAPPPPQTNQNASAFSGNVETPPFSNYAGGIMGFSDDNTSVPPPPQTASSAMGSANLEDETPPPPANESQANEAQANEPRSKEGIAPPQPPMPKNPKAP